MADAPNRANRRGLGRGLSALLGEQPGGAPDAATEVDVIRLALDDIAPHPDQPRRRIDPAALEALATSLREHGLMQPVVVRAANGGYQLIAGERRWRAARQAGLTHIPAVVRDADDRARLELALVENMVREDLSPIEVANAVAVLVEDFGQSHQAVATHLGRSRPAVSNLLRLLELPDDVQQMIDAGRLTEGHGRAVLMAEGARERRRLAGQAADGGWSVRELERRARAADPRPRGAANDPSAREPDTGADDDTVDAFAAAFDVPVRVRRVRGGAVTVELRFPDTSSVDAAVARLRG
ncbi:MAG: ParB/RepB/Spo0J family partition protein [Thermoleophilia bacterium]|nr:ParB/RepB/Spo0J family partition protein [Thermoleophilia bacterium]